jgi:hypothetical protein
VDPFEAWRPFIRAARANLARKRFPDNISPEWVKRQLDSMRCSPNYPDLVAHNVVQSRELCVAGCLFYELFTTSIHYAVAACEVALKERFLDVLPLPCRITLRRPEGLEERTWATRPHMYELVEAVGQGWRLEKPFNQFRPTLGYLMRWAEERDVISPHQSQWFDHHRRMRNAIAHGHNMVVSPSSALGTLRQTIMTLNTMFPDQETTLYDDRMRREREKLDEEWWREFEGMLRSLPDELGEGEGNGGV